ncbi:MAG: flavin reductase family protein [Candidatus Atribacteria bacterium]|nr:flavin reductase family protein [Candidatus Atribacteria bacterium]
MKKSIGAKTFLGAVPLLVIGSYDRKERPNLATVAWGGICCSEPPCVNISLRKNRYSYHNILARQAFTVNILFGDRVKEADFYGLISGEKHDKFEMSGITPIKSDLVDAPYGKEFPLVLECKVIHTLEIGVHTEFVGEILDIKAEDYLLDERGKIDTGKLDPILYTPEAGEYYGRGDYLGRSYKIGKSIISE